MEHRSHRWWRLPAMLTVAVLLLGVGVAFVPNLIDSSTSDTAPTTTFDPRAVIEASSPYRCAQALAPVVEEMIDTGKIDPALRAWGASGPAFRATQMLFTVVYPLVYQEGDRVAAQRLAEGSTNLCFDGDVANDVLLLSSGDVGYVTACLDGRLPATVNDVCQP